MKTLYFQTDTTGAFLFREAVTHPQQPHLVRLAWVVADDDDIVDEKSRLIVPRPTWEYEPDAVVAHGVLRETAVKHGISVDRAVALFIEKLQDVDRVVAFNIDFHQKVMQRAAAECALPWQNMFSGKTVDCAMRRATDIVQKPRMQPGGGYSWPKLKEAYEFFAVGEELPSIDTDPIIRGILLARCVYTIDQGILAHQRAVSRDA